MTWWWRSYPPRTPSPCRGASWSQKSRTWRRQTGSRRTWGCLAPRRPVGSGSSGSGSACWSSSWRNAAESPCDAPETRRYTERQISDGTRIDQHSCCVIVSCSSFVFLSEYQRCESKSLLPVGSVTDELDVLKVFLSGCFGFSLRWSCWDGRYLTLKHTESTFMGWTQSFLCALSITSCVADGQFWSMAVYSHPLSRQSLVFLGSRCHSCSAGPFLQRHQSQSEQETWREKDVTVTINLDVDSEVVLPSRGSLVRPSWLMMYRGMSHLMPWPSLAWPSAASNKW